MSSAMDCDVIGRMKTERVRHRDDVKNSSFSSSFMDSLSLVRNKIMYVLSWRTVSALTRVLFWCLFHSLLRNSGNKHQNNPLVSAETVRHSSAYIILYISIMYIYIFIIYTRQQIYVYSIHILWILILPAQRPMDSWSRVINKVMYALSWRTDSALTRVLFWRLFYSLLRNSGNKRQSNPLVSTATVRHSRTYIDLYVSICIYILCMHASKYI